MLALNSFGFDQGLLACSISNCMSMAICNSCPGPVYEMRQEQLSFPSLNRRHSQSGRVSRTIRSRSTFSVPFRLVACNEYVPASFIFAWWMTSVVVDPPWYSS